MIVATKSINPRLLLVCSVLGLRMTFTVGQPWMFESIARVLAAARRRRAPLGVEVPRPLWPAQVAAGRSFDCN